MSTITTAVDVARVADVFEELFLEPDLAEIADVPVARVTATVDGLAITHSEELRAACGPRMAELLAPLLDGGWAAVLVLRESVAGPHPRIAKHLGARRVRERLAEFGVSGERWGAIVEVGAADRRELATVVRLPPWEVGRALRLTWGWGSSPLLLVRDPDRLDLTSKDAVRTLLDAFWPEEAGVQHRSTDLSHVLRRRVLPSGDALVVGWGSHDDPDRQLLCLNAPPQTLALAGVEPDTGFVVEVVAEGSWLHDEAVRRPVWIARANYDFWYEIAVDDGTTEPGETATLDEHGMAYYVAFRERPAERFWPDSGPHLSLREAMRAAGERVPGAIDWRR